MASGLGPLPYSQRPTSEDFGEPFDVLRAVSPVEPLSRAVQSPRSKTQDLTPSTQHPTSVIVSADGAGARADSRAADPAPPPEPPRRIAGRTSRRRYRAQPVLPSRCRRGGRPPRRAAAGRPPRGGGPCGEGPGGA